MDPATENLQKFLNQENKNYVTVAKFKEAFLTLHKALENLKKKSVDEQSESIEEIKEALGELESGFKKRLGETNADLGTKASKSQIKAISDTIDSIKADLDLAYLNIEEVRTEIPETITVEEVTDDILKKRDWLPVEVIKGGNSLISKSQFETAIVEIGGKLTVLEKRNAKGYGALGGGSEGTGSLFLERLRDVDVSGLTKNSDGKYELGTGTGSALTVQDIDGTPTAINVNTIKFTNGAVTDDGGGVVTVNVSGSGGGGDVSSNTGVSVDSEVALFSGTGGKTIKRATGTGVATLTSGVLGTATATIAELNFLSGVTSNVQTQLNAKGAGTVTSVTSANGAATIATTTTTPVITIVSAPKLTTARTIAGVSFDGSANISLNNNAITNGAGYTTNTGTVTGTGTTNELSYWSSSTAQGSLSTATYPSLTELTYVKGVTSAVQTQLDGKQASGSYLTGNQTITLSGDVTGSGATAITTTIAAGAVDIAMLSATGTPTSSNFLRGDNTWATPAGSGDMTLASAQTNSGIKTFLNTTMKLRNVANTFDGYFVNTNTADRIYTLKDAAGTIAFISDITGTNSGTNTGDQTSVTGNAGTVTNGLYTTDVGSVVQAYDADLTTWAGITPGTGVATALAVSVGSTGAFLTFNGAGGTPSSLTGTNITGTATGLTSGITNALKSATTTVDVSAATAPTTGQVLTATSSTTATWQTASSGFADPLTTNGDIIARVAGATTRLAQGANDTFLGVSAGVLGYYTPSGAGTLQAGEVPTGTVNSSNTAFTLSYTPSVAGAVIVVLNGVVQYNGTDYTITGTTITFTTAPVTGSTIYAYNGVTGAGGGGSGTVTSVSVATANGFAGTVATATTTPAITITTSITGLLKGNGTAISAATAGTDYLTPTGSAAALTSFPTFNQSTTGNAATVTGFTAGVGTLTGPASSGVAATLGNAEAITGVKTMSGLNVITHSSSGLIVRNPANTFSYTLTGAAIAADRILTLPLITGTATLAVLSLAQTFTGVQTFTSPATTTSITTASASFTAWAGATTLLTIGGTGASASLFAPSTLDTTSSITGAIRTSGGISAAKALNIGTTATIGGNIILGVNSITMSGSLATTGARVTKGWFTDIESTNMPTVGGTAILSSLTAPQFTTIELGNATDTTLSRSSAGVLAVEGVVVPTISSTSTLTNKTMIATTNVVEEITSTASSATPTPTGGSLRNFFKVTALAAGATFAIPSGTAADGNYLTIRIKDNATAQTLAFNAIYRFIGVTAPTTTVISKTMYLTARYNFDDTKWDVLAVGQEA